MWIPPTILGFDDVNPLAFNNCSSGSGWFNWCRTGSSGSGDDGGDNGCGSGSSGGGGGGGGGGIIHPLGS